ncbi:hypothetical protein BGY98DRAFT_540436 [Russula aff. rugulosa BPL654]|nr:hypothetical protein BGY98DRAFT_540436 [Russula aff. rugulosa BPL654]
MTLSFSSLAVLPAALCNDFHLDSIRKTYFTLAVSGEPRSEDSYGVLLYCTVHRVSRPFVPPPFPFFFFQSFPHPRCLIAGFRSSGTFEFLGWSGSVFYALEASWLSCRRHKPPIFHVLQTILLASHRRARMR